MLKSSKLAVCTLCVGLALLGYLLGARHGSRRAASGQAGDIRRVLYYVDPMNPAHTSDKPGLAPCGMKMEPVYADAMPSSGKAMAPMLPGTVRVPPDKQQLIGVQIAPVASKSLQYTLRLLGKVAADETRIYRINATVNGWITKALPFATGSAVKQNETLATFYSPEFLSAGQALLFALNSKDRVQAPAKENPATSNQVSQFNINIQQYRDSLRNLGMGELQIDEMIRARKFMQHVNLVSPADGFIAGRNISQGQRFEKGTELFRVVDLSRVWILADVFEKQGALLQPGAVARVTLPGQNRTFTATVGQALPQFDSVTRALKLRLETDNPDFALKPDMFVDVEFPVSLEESLVVPADAVLDAGTRQTVFVDLGHGYFEPRSVQTGGRLGGEVQIIQGLMPGERIVISGHFLIDSESRMKLAAAGVSGAPTIDPICGMAVDEQEARAAGLVSAHQGHTSYFCCDPCKRKFDQNPARFLNRRAEAPGSVSSPAPAMTTSTNPPPHRDQPPH